MQKPTYNPDHFFYWHRLTTRFRDLDPLNHVNNAVFNTYFEEARVNFVNHVPELEHSFEQGEAFVLAKLTIEYFRPVLCPSTLLIGSSCLNIGNTSVEAFQAMFHAETKKLHATAISKGVWFDINTQRPTHVPKIANLDRLIYKPL